mgnify:CR=1 FL=1
MDNVECENCGSPLEQAGAVCAFCGCKSSALPRAEVPLQHQRGEGRTITKTYDDSLRSIQEGVEHSARVHEKETRRFKIWLPILMVALAFPMLLTLYSGYQASKPPGDFNALLDTGVELISRGAYTEGHREILEAVKVRPDAPEGRLIMGAAYFAEVLEKPYLDGETRDKLLNNVRREMHFVLQAEKDNPRAHLFMGLYRHQVGESAEAMEHLESTIANISQCPDGPRKELYRKAAEAALLQLRTSAGNELNLYSEVDDTLGPEQARGIEVPFGR